MNCPYHPNAPAIRVCTECGGHFCSTCAPLKKGKTICKQCKEDMMYVMEKTGLPVAGEGASLSERHKPSSKDIKTNRMSRLVQKAEDQAKHLKSVRICAFHKEIEAVAACCQCKKNVCEKCIAFEDKEELFCPDCWTKIPLAKRLSRKSKGRW